MTGHGVRQEFVGILPNTRTSPETQRKSMRAKESGMRAEERTENPASQAEP
jgi:hypothetical protein